MLLDNQQREFINKIAVEHKSVYTAAKEMGIPVNRLFEWYDDFLEEITRIKMEHAYEIIDKYKLSQVSDLEYNAKLLNKLKAELENRDFSGLPTDKLYFLLNDVRQNINKILDSIDDVDDFDDFDDFLDDDEFFDYE